MPHAAEILNGMIVSRDRYLQKLVRCRENGLVKVITGIRRCGKSILLSKFFHDWLLADGVAENHMYRSPNGGGLKITNPSLSAATEARCEPGFLISGRRYS